MQLNYAWLTFYSLYVYVKTVIQMDGNFAAAVKMHKYFFGYIVLHLLFSELDAVGPVTIHFHCIEKSSLDILLNFCFCVPPKKEKIWTH